MLLIIHSQVIIFSFLSLIAHADSNIVDCDYSTDNYKTQLGYLYRCYVTNDLNIIARDSTIASVRGSHRSGMSNNNVTSFNAYNTNTNYFPKGEKFFLQIL
ncbi:hypothetical protein ACKWTF_015424 [Chironomus riparius]